MSTFTVLTSAFNDGATDTPAAARAQYYTNWTAIGKVSDVGAASAVVKTDASGNAVLTGGLTAGGAGAGNQLKLYQARTAESASTISEVVLKLPDLTVDNGGMSVSIANIGVGDGRVRTTIADSSNHQYSYEVIVNGNTTTFARDGSLYIPNNVLITGQHITATSTPASAAATGTAGTWAWDANYIYICTATNTWKRVAIATW